MNLLLTDDQQKTLLNLCEQIIDEKGGARYLHFKFHLRDLGNGCFEQLNWQQLPQSVKDQIITKREP